MKLKKNQKVIVIAGKDKGKVGVIERALPAVDKVVVGGVNVVKRHQKSSREGQKGQILEKTMPIHISNVMLIDAKENKRTRIGKKWQNGQYVKYAKRSGSLLK